MDEDQLTSKLKEAQEKLISSLLEYRPVRQKCVENRQSITSLYDKIRQESGADSASSKSDQTTKRVAKLSNYHRSKLKTAYNNALKDVGSETQRLRACLDQLHELRRLREEKRRLLFKKQLQQATPAGGLGPGEKSLCIQ